MGLKDKLRGLTASTADLDAERRQKFAESVVGAVHIGDAKPREDVTVAGEVVSLRIVPKQGASWLEATITDGTGSLFVMWTGRRRIAGVKPGAKIKIHGRGAPAGPGGRLLVYNPDYELL